MTAYDKEQALFHYSKVIEYANDPSFTNKTTASKALVSLIIKLPTLKIIINRKFGCSYSGFIIVY